MPRPAAPSPARISPTCCVRHAPKQMPAEACSTGEQKALLIGLVLAQARLVAQLTGETPVILLDEIAAHLDETRRLALFEVLDELGCQAFMTGTDAAVFAPLGERAQMLAVHDGAVANLGDGRMTVTLDDATAALKSIFGYDAFRAGPGRDHRRRAGRRGRPRRHADRQRQVALLSSFRRCSTAASRSSSRR